MASSGCLYTHMCTMRWRGGRLEDDVEVDNESLRCVTGGAMFS